MYTMSSFKSTLSSSLTGLTPDSLIDEIKGGKFFQEAGIYDVMASEIVTATPKAGGAPYKFIPIVDATGRDGRIFFSLFDKKGAPQIFNLQKTLMAFGYSVRQAVIGSLLAKDPEAAEWMFSKLCVGPVKLKAEWWNYHVHSPEKGVFILVDRDGAPFEDPLVQEVLPHTTRQTCAAYATAKGLNFDAGLHLSLFEPSPEFKMSEEQEEIYATLAAMTAAIAEGKQVVVEKPAEKKPLVWAK